MAKEVIVVGDHEQVSPDAVGQQVAQIAALQETFLRDIPNKHLYDGQLSLYDLARQSFGGTVCLREHFRCAPEIIQFSNVLSYDRKIKPLRDTTSIRVKPPLVTCCLQEGQRRGDHNDEEALTIASLIVAAIDQPEYEGALHSHLSDMPTTRACDIAPRFIDYRSSIPALSWLRNRSRRNFEEAGCPSCRKRKHSNSVPRRALHNR